MLIEHIAIWTRDLARLRVFYTTYYGAVASKKYTNLAKGFTSYFLTFESGARLELMSVPELAPAPDAPAPVCGIAHFAFATGSAEAVDALTARLRADGFAVLDGPRRTGDGYYESVVLDPDSNRIEITI